MEPKDVRRRLLEREPLGVSHDEGDDSRECRSAEGTVVNRGRDGFWCAGADGGVMVEAMARGGPSIKGPGTRRVELVW